MPESLSHPHFFHGSAPFHPPRAWSTPHLLLALQLLVYSFLASLTAPVLLRSLFLPPTLREALIYLLTQVIHTVAHLCILLSLEKSHPSSSLISTLATAYISLLRLLHEFEITVPEASWRGLLSVVWGFACTQRGLSILISVHCYLCLTSPSLLLRLLGEPPTPLPPHLALLHFALSLLLAPLWVLLLRSAAPLLPWVASSFSDQHLTAYPSWLHLTPLDFVGQRTPASTEMARALQAAADRSGTRSTLAITYLFLRAVATLASYLATLLLAVVLRAALSALHCFTVQLGTCPNSLPAAGYNFLLAPSISLVGFFVYAFLAAAAFLALANSLTHLILAAVLPPMAQRLAQVAQAVQAQGGWLQVAPPLTSHYASPEVVAFLRTLLLFAAFHCFCGGSLLLLPVLFTLELLLRQTLPHILVAGGVDEGSALGRACAAALGVALLPAEETALPAEQGGAPGAFLSAAQWGTRLATAEAAGRLGAGHGCCICWETLGEEAGGAQEQALALARAGLSPRGAERARTQRLWRGGLAGAPAPAAAAAAAAAQDPFFATPPWVEEPAALALTSCAHSYHASCLVRWCRGERAAGRPPSCPFCRNAGGSFRRVFLAGQVGGEEGEQEESEEESEGVEEEAEEQGVAAVEEEEEEEEEEEGGGHWTEVHASFLRNRRGRGGGGAGGGAGGGGHGGGLAGGGAQAPTQRTAPPPIAAAASVATFWACQLCTFHNDLQSRRCGMCEGVRRG